jgi:hypothetical protein
VTKAGVDVPWKKVRYEKVRMGNKTARVTARANKTRLLPQGE